VPLEVDLRTDVLALLSTIGLGHVLAPFARGLREGWREATQQHDDADD